MPVLWGTVVIAVGFGLWSIADAIGDRREAKVWSKINGAIEKTNVDVARFSDLDDKIAAVAYEARVRALADAKKISQEKYLLTKEQADALNNIR
jgi:hypothetical protein